MAITFLIANNKKIEQSIIRFNQVEKWSIIVFDGEK